MADKRTFTVEVAGKDVGGKKAFHDLGLAAQATEAPVKIAHKSLDELTKLVTGRFGAAGAEAKKIFDGIGQSALTSGNVAAVGLGVGVAAVGAFVAKGVEHYLHLASAVRTFQRTSGATAEDSSKMVAALHVLGISSDQVATGMFRLGVNVAKHSDKLRESGVEIAKNKQGNTDLLGTLLNVGDAYKKQGDQAAKSKLVMDSFGRSGVAMIPILGKSREEIEHLWDAAERHNEVFTQHDLDNARLFGVAMREAGAAVEGITITAGKGAVPILTGLAIVTERVVGKLDDFTSSSGAGAKAVGFFTNVLKQIPGLNVLNYLYDLGSAHNKAKEAADADTEQTQQFADASAALVKSMRSELDAQHDVTAALRSRKDAYANLADAQKDLAKLLKDGAVDEKKVTAARRDRDAANRSLNKSTEDLNDAEQALAAIVGNGAVDEKKVTDARKALDDANDQLANSTQKVADAQKDLDKLLKAGAVDAKAVASARRGLETADRNAATAAERLKEAQQELNDVLAGPSARDTEDAQLSVAEATNAVASATLRLHSASNKLQETKDDQAATSDDLQQATLDESDAKLSLRRAELALLDAQKAAEDLSKRSLPTSQAVKDATKRVAEAQQDLTDAIRDQTDARNELATAQAGDPEFEDKIAEARRKVEDATKDVAKALKEAKERQDDLNTALAGDPEYMKKVEDARRKVRDATQGMADAARDASDKMDALKDAQKGDPEFQDKVRDARDKVAKATQSIADANYNVWKREGELKDKQKELNDLVAQTPAAVGPAITAMGNYAGAIRSVIGAIDDVNSKPVRPPSSGGGGGGGLTPPSGPQPARSSPGTSEQWPPQDIVDKYINPAVITQLSTSNPHPADLDYGPGNKNYISGDIFGGNTDPFYNYGPRNGASPRIPSFDEGGVVPGRTGEAVMAKVHAGETIWPTHKNRSMGSPVVIDASKLKAGDKIDATAFIAAAREAERRTGYKILKTS